VRGSASGTEQEVDDGAGRRAGPRGSPGAGRALPAGAGRQAEHRVHRQGGVGEAVRGVDDVLGARIGQAADWRKDYVRAVVSHTVAATRSPEASLTVARQGLAALGARMRFERDGSTTSVAEALRDGQSRLATRTVTGEGERVRELVVPYRGRAAVRGPAAPSGRRLGGRWEGRAVLRDGPAPAPGRAGLAGPVRPGLRPARSGRRAGAAGAADAVGCARPGRGRRAAEAVGPGAGHGSGRVGHGHRAGVR
jgi:hypothetical protein